MPSENLPAAPSDEGGAPLGARAADRGGEAAIAATRREARREALRPCDGAEGGADARADARDGGADGGGGARTGEARAEGAIGERFDGGDFGAARDARAAGFVRLDDDGGAGGAADGGGLRLDARGDTRGGSSDGSASDGTSSDGTSSVCASSDEVLLRLEERGVSAFFLFPAACDDASATSRFCRLGGGSVSTSSLSASFALDGLPLLVEAASSSLLR